MRELTQTEGRRTLYLLSNGDIPAWISQEMYEYAWAEGIRPLRESDLKPDNLLKKRRKAPGGSMSSWLEEMNGGFAQ